MVVHCPKCRKRYQVPDEHVGKQVRCGACSVKFVAVAKQQAKTPSTPPPPPVPSTTAPGQDMSASGNAGPTPPPIVRAKLPHSQSESSDHTDATIEAETVTAQPSREKEGNGQTPTKRSQGTDLNSSTKKTWRDYVVGLGIAYVATIVVTILLSVLAANTTDWLEDRVRRDGEEVSSEGPSDLAMFLGLSIPGGLCLASAYGLLTLPREKKAGMGIAAMLGTGALVFLGVVLDILLLVYSGIGLLRIGWNVAAMIPPMILWPGLIALGWIAIITAAIWGERARRAEATASLTNEEAPLLLPIMEMLTRQRLVSAAVTHLPMLLLLFFNPLTSSLSDAAVVYPLFYFLAYHWIFGVMIIATRGNLPLYDGSPRIHELQRALFVPSLADAFSGILTIRAKEAHQRTPNEEKVNLLGMLLGIVLMPLWVPLRTGHATLVWWRGQVVFPALNKIRHLGTIVLLIMLVVAALGIVSL